MGSNRKGANLGNTEPMGSQSAEPPESGAPPEPFFFFFFFFPAALLSPFGVLSHKICRAVSWGFLSSSLVPWMVLSVVALLEIGTPCRVVSQCRYLVNKRFGPL